MFRGWNPSHPSGVGAGVALVPMLFITIACGACSGFHSLIASGTTSKQLRNEMDAKPVAYGSKVRVGLVAVVSLARLPRFGATMFVSFTRIRPLPTANLRLRTISCIRLSVSLVGALLTRISTSFASTRFTTSRS